MARGKVREGRIVERIYGRDGEHDTLYLWRMKCTPTTRWGGLYFHVFHRGDADPDTHDHPWEFWTFPLVSYNEEVRVTKNDTVYFVRRRVRRFRLHHRRATYSHRVLSQFGGGRIYTFIWHGPKVRRWGFWVKGKWVHWKEYVYGASH